MPEHGFCLPEEDRVRSPHTGYTRGHWEAAADGLLHAALRYASPGGALLDLPGPPSRSGTRSDGLEGFARTFLLAAIRVAGDQGADRHGFLARYTEGMVNGTRAPGGEDAESWPLIDHCQVFGQPMVESASVALALHLTRRWSWDSLDAPAQDRVESWLRGALRKDPAPNNWYLFPLTVAGFLRSVGRADQETERAITRGLGLLDGWYRGQGWYTDGDGRAFDHYNGWAMHTYPVLHAQLTGNHPLLDHLGPRLDSFLRGYSLMFDGNGAPLYQGRSLTYRIATGAAVALGALTGHTPLAPGATRRVLSGTLRYFLTRGALTDGLLSLGWHGPHRATLQRYSGPGSPYWAAKGFLALLLPGNHPVWTDREEPAPVESHDRALTLSGPGLLVQTSANDGLVRVHNHGSDNRRAAEAQSTPDDPLYSRFAYSTRTGPTAAGNIADNHLAIELRGVRSVRRRIHPLGSGTGWSASYHHPVFPAGGPALPSARVDSITVVRGRLEVRIHRLVNVPDNAVVRQTGWAIALDRPPAHEGHPTVDGAEPATPAEVLLGNAEVTGQLAAAHGFTGQRMVRAPQGTAFGAWAMVPELHGTLSAGPDPGLFVALASLTGDTEPAPLARLVQVSVRGPVVRLRWPDGESTAVDLSDSTPVVTEQPALGGVATG